MEQKTIQLQIQRVYVKEQSCRLPHAPAIFKEEGKPETQLAINVAHSTLLEHIYEVVVLLQTTTTINNQVALEIIVHQAGIFKLEVSEPEQLRSLLGVYCPTILYPYACRVVSDKVRDAEFPPLHLTPVNFEELYREQQNKEASSFTSNIESGISTQGSELNTIKKDTLQ